MCTAAKAPLSWASRVQIALDAARGLEYIHEHTRPSYIHRDIKSANILLDEQCHAKVPVRRAVPVLFLKLHLLGDDKLEVLTGLLLGEGGRFWSYETHWDKNRRLRDNAYESGWYLGLHGARVSWLLYSIHIHMITS